MDKEAKNKKIKVLSLAGQTSVNFCFNQVYCLSDPTVQETF